MEGPRDNTELHYFFFLFDNKSHSYFSPVFSLRLYICKYHSSCIILNCNRRHSFTVPRQLHLSFTLDVVDKLIL